MQSRNNLQNAKEIIDRLAATNYKPIHNEVIVSGNNSTLIGANGKQYLDFLSGYSVGNLGNSHPRIAKIISNQANKLSVCSRYFYHEPLADMLIELEKATGAKQFLPMTTGVEAVESAIKLARLWGYNIKNIPNDKAEIICCINGFHGRMITTSGLLSLKGCKDGFGPFTPGFKIIPFDNIETLQQAINKNTCAFIVEPIQGEAGVIIPSDNYLEKVRGICDKNNILLIFDEIQTGLGRTGKMFAFEHFNVKPDLFTLGKSLGGGVEPVSIVGSYQNNLMDLFKPGSHGGTFSGNPMACACAAGTLKILKEEKLIENSATLGEYLSSELKSLSSTKQVTAVRSKGLYAGIDTLSPSKDICKKLAEEGLLCSTTYNEKGIRLIPPLTISKSELQEGIQILKKVLTDFGN